MKIKSKAALLLGIYGAAGATHASIVPEGSDRVILEIEVQRRGQSLPTCNETQARLQVAFFDVDIPTDAPIGGANPYIVLRSSASVDRQPILDISGLQAIDECVPNDECLALGVYGLNSSNFEIMWDGEVVEAGPQLPYFESVVTTTELGSNCTVQCSEGESLFELELFFGDVEKSEWQIRDANDTIVAAFIDRDSLNFFELTHDRMCLQANECYYFLFAQSFSLPDDPFYYDVKIDGKLVGSGDNSIQFNTIDIGICEDDCGDSESLFEFFLFRRYLSSHDGDLSWELKDALDNNFILEGTIERDSNFSLHHTSECVPEGSCLSFFLQVPPSEREVFSSELNPYFLSLGGTIFREGSYWFYKDASEYNETTYLGSCDSLCNETEGESLFEVSLQTDIGGPYCRWCTREGVKWNLGSSNESETSFIATSDDLFDFYRGNTTYSALQCVPAMECLNFDINTDATAVYTVKRDGVVLERRVENDDTFPTTTTPFGCPSTSSESLSAGAIAGIVVGSLVGLIIVIFLFALYKIKRKDSRSRPDEKDDTSSMESTSNGPSAQAV